MATRARVLVAVALAAVALTACGAKPGHLPFSPPMMGTDPPKAHVTTTTTP